MTASLSIATYNWPAALERSLQSVLAQSVLPAEVLIADDGSRDDTRTLIERYQKTFPIPLVHVWQPDEGFQLSRIRNKAILAAKGDYIIQVDGDVILHPKFIEDHIRFARPGCYVTGSRVLLPEALTKELLTADQPDYELLRSKGTNFFNRLHMPWLSNFLAHRYKKDPFDVRGCNMAFWKADLIKVNGYNEAFTGWGREDSELSVRLTNAGVRKRFLKGGGIMFHLWHKEASRANEAENTRMLEQTQQQRITYAVKGLAQHSI